MRARGVDHGIGQGFEASSFVADGSKAIEHNTVGITCYQDRNYCSYTSVHAIGANHIARMNPSSEYDIVKWDDDEIIAEDQFNCQKITITVDRKAALNVLLTTTPKSAVAATLRKANHAAILNLSSGGALNEARANAGIALSSLLHSQPTSEKIDKAKRAVEEWIGQLGKP
jgi:hypothetical protein